MVAGTTQFEYIFGFSVWAILICCRYYKFLTFASINYFYVLILCSILWRDVKQSFVSSAFTSRLTTLRLTKIVVFLIVFMSSPNQHHSVHPKVICHFHSLLVFLGSVLNWTNYIWIKKVEATCIKIFWENLTSTFLGICKLCCDSTLLHMNIQKDR
jgi:hypothetical protein